MKQGSFEEDFPTVIPTLRGTPMIDDPLPVASRGFGKRAGGALSGVPRVCLGCGWDTALAWTKGLERPLEAAR